jgi:hypothetical protein
MIKFRLACPQRPQRFGELVPRPRGMQHDLLFSLCVGCLNLPSWERNSTFLSAPHLKFDLCSCIPWIAWSFGRILSASNSSVLTMSTAEGLPSTHLIIRDETFVIPISSRDLAFLASHLRNRSGSRHIVPVSNICLSNPRSCLLFC